MNVILNLKEPVKDQINKIIHEPQLLEISSEEIKQKTNSELYAMAPVLDFGTLILRILSTAIKPKDMEDTAKLFVYIRSIRNKYETTKAEWHLEEKDIKEIKDFLKKIEGSLKSPMMGGQVWEKISDLEIELKGKTKQIQ